MPPLYLQPQPALAELLAELFKVGDFSGLTWALYAEYKPTFSFSSSSSFFILNGKFQAHLKVEKLALLIDLCFLLYIDKL